MAWSKTKELRILNSWEGQLALFAIFASLMYWFLSYAIDSGRTLEWAAAITFGLLALKSLFRSIKHLFKK